MKRLTDDQLEAKRFLMRIRNQEDRVRQLRRLKARALDAETSITARYGPGGGGSSGRTRPGENHAVFSASIDEEMDRLDSIRTETISVISGIENNTLAAILIAFYVNDMPWVDIANELHYSYDYARGVLHGRALSALAAILKENTQYHMQA